MDRDAYARWLGAFPGQATASLYLHVPFCRATCWYCGCHTTITRRDEPISSYLAALKGEVELVADRLGRPVAVRHVHFGGGTPTIMEPFEFGGLIELLGRRFRLDPGARLGALEEDGVIRFDGNVVSVSEDARLLVRAVAAAFDAHLGSSGRLHSRAV